jgi:hypothetical protein
MRQLRQKSSVAADLVKGALAGAVATGVMDRLTTVLYEKEGQGTRHREDTARAGRTAYDAAAERAAAMMGKQLNDRQRQRMGQAVHWTLGVGAGVTYALLRHRVPGLRRLGGAKFGTAFWATVDEGLVAALGLTPPPQAFPFQTHARGLIGHLAFGLVTDRTLRILDAVV